MERLMPIGSLARATGVKVPTVRYYESVGLLPVPLRTDSNRRLYDAAAVRRLRFIRHARQLGFEIEAIRQLLDLADRPKRACDAVDAIAGRHLADIESKIARLAALHTEVRRMISQCKQGTIADCRVIEVLADHGKCAQEHS